MTALDHPTRHRRYRLPAAARLPAQRPLSRWAAVRTLLGGGRRASVRRPEQPLVIVPGS